MRLNADRSGCVEEPVRSLLRIEGALLLAALIASYAWIHANWIVFAVLLLLPDVAMAGYLRNTRLGAWCYNAAHTYVAPILLAIVSYFDRALLPFAIVWAAHIAMDRALGYGLKYGD